jgi:urease accessory protein
MPAVVLLLSDARLPAGGHAHSAQIEAAAAAGLVDTVDDLFTFLRGRLARGGAQAAAFAAAACVQAVRDPLRWDALDAELDARTPSPAIRASSRHQGRTLVRAASTAWPSVALTALARQPGGPHHPLVVGCIAGATGCTPVEAALVAAYLSVSGPASAAVRLLGLDPLSVNAGIAQLASDIDAVATEAATYADGPPADLPSSSAPLVDLLAEDHATWEVRLFAS